MAQRDLSDAAYHVASERFRRAIAALYSPEWFEVEHALRDRQSWAIEPAVAFLETDLWCFRSGYAKERLMRWLARLDLSSDAQARLHRWILDALAKGPRREYRRMVILARSVATADFARSLEELAGRSTPTARSSVLRVADAVATAQAHRAERLGNSGAPDRRTLSNDPAPASQATIAPLAWVLSMREDFGSLDINEQDAVLRMLNIERVDLDVPATP